MKDNEDILLWIPPLTYSPEFGTVQEYVYVTREWATHWGHTPHQYVKCCACTKCIDCKGYADDPIHGGL